MNLARHPRRVFWALLLVPLLLLNAALAVGAHWLLPIAEDEAQVFALLSAAVLTGFCLSCAWVVLWAALDLYLLQPMAALGRGVEIIARTHPEHQPELPDGNLLGDLPRSVADLAEQLRRARAEVAEAQMQGAARAETQKHCLEQILHEIDTAVLFCDEDHRVRLFNRAATRLLGPEGDLGIGRSVLGLLNPGPLRQALDYLRARPSGGAAEPPSPHLVLATHSGTRMLRVRLALVALPARTGAGFLLTLDDAGDRLRLLGERDRLLCQAVDGLRDPLAALRAAVENLAAHPQMPAASRREFDAVVARETGLLAQRLQILNERRRSLLWNQWMMCDVPSSELASNLQHRLHRARGPRLVATGRPLWLHCDPHALVALLEHLLLRLQTHLDCASFDLAAVAGDERIYIDLIWTGEPVPEPVVESWLDTPLADLVGIEHARDVVECHNGAIWSQAYGRPGTAVLRLPVPAAERNWLVETEALPARPEFYDFDWPGRSDHSLEDTPLDRLEYVVFDTETTGLRPSEGDRIVSLAGVRIVNGRILSGEVFDQLVNPGRAIPSASTRFHHITDQQVRDRPPLSVVLPAFRRFVGDAVLVAHNAAFDLRFLSLETGPPMENPVLDVLLLSAFLHDHVEDHGLDAIARRLGVEVRQRHSALGDSMVTAEVFLRLLDLLRAREVLTLGQARRATEAQIELRRRQSRF